MAEGRQVVDWRPTAELETLRRRAELLGEIRAFFAARGILEVETPALSSATVTDLHLASLSCLATLPGGATRLFLQTSPEFAMKRLLASGSGPIFQICKAFRDEERGRRHNLEFSMLEWYRPGFDHHRLMDEMDSFLQTILDCASAERLPYGELFESYFGICPHTADSERLATELRRRGIDLWVQDSELDRDDALNLLFSQVLEPDLGADRPLFVYDYPASQAALARIRPGAPPVAERFEVFYRGMELANGFHELADAGEQRRRFEADLEARQSSDLPAPPMDERLLSALASGFPDCAGVALGIDRLLMLALDKERIDEVMAFPADRA